MNEYSLTKYITEDKDDMFHMFLEINSSQFHTFIKLMTYVVNTTDTENDNDMNKIGI